MNVEFAPRRSPERPKEEDSFQIGPVGVDLRTREVRFEGQVERLQDKPLSVLRLLAEHRGQLVTRETIVDECWDGRIVGDDVINRAISILRKLGRRAGGFKIDTVPRAGYRLIEYDGPAQSRQWALLGVAVAAAILLTALFLLRAPHPNPEPALPSVRVGQDRDSSGEFPLQAELTEAVREVGYPVSSPNAELILDARVVNDAGSPRINVMLANAGSALPLLTNSFKRPGASFDDLAVEAVADTASALSMVEPLLRLAKDRNDPAERAALFSIVENFRQFDAFRARQLAIQAVRDFPDSPAAQYAFAVATILTMEGLPENERAADVLRARQALDLSVKLAPRVGASGKSWCVVRPRVWMAECEKRLRRSLDDPAWRTESRQALVELYAESGRFAEGAQLSRFAVSDEPYVPRGIQQRLILLEMIGHHREAESLYADAIRKFPENWSIRWGRIIGLAAAGNFQGLRSVVKAIPEGDFTFDSAIVQRISGAYLTRDVHAVKKECAKPRLRGSTRHVCLSALSLLGETAAAMAVAEELFPAIAGRDAREDERLWLKTPNYFTTVFLSSPAGAPLRRDPRFDELAERTGLQRYWRWNPPDFCRGATPDEACSRLIRRS